MLYLSFNWLKLIIVNYVIHYHFVKLGSVLFVGQSIFTNLNPLQSTSTYFNLLQPTSPFSPPNVLTKTTGPKFHMILYKLLKL